MGVIVYTPIHNRKVEMQENTKFKITYYSNKDKKHKKHITRNAKWTNLCKYFTSKQGTPCITYYDEDAHGYRTATTTWKVRH